MNGLPRIAERVPGVCYNDTPVTTWPRFDIATGKGGAELVTDATETETRPSEGVMDVLAWPDDPGQDFQHLRRELTRMAVHARHVPALGSV